MYLAFTRLPGEIYLEVYFFGEIVYRVFTRMPGQSYLRMLGLMYLVTTRMPGESYHRQRRSLISFLYDAFRALINPLVC